MGEVPVIDVNQATQQLVESFERLVLIAFQVKGDAPTIGFGHTSSAGSLGQGLGGLGVQARLAGASKKLGLGGAGVNWAFAPGGVGSPGFSLFGLQGGETPAPAPAFNPFAIV
jgi:hypothetical protein